MKLVSDVGNWWRWHSVWALAFVGIVANAWLNSPQFQALFPAWMVSVVSPVFIGAVFLLRIRDQALRLPAPKPTVPPSNDSHQGDGS